MKNSIVLLAACAVLAPACSPTDADATVDFTRVTEALESVDAPGISRVHTLAGIYLSGQPDEAGFEAARAGGVRTVINLRHDDEIELPEREVVEGLGMTYVHLSWDGEDELTDEIFDRTRELLKSAEKPILLHCKSANRAGAVWLPFRVLDGGLSFDEALAEARTVGLKKDAYEAKARGYVERR